MTLHQFLARSEFSLNTGVDVPSMETVIRNLREVAERLAPGRACISVVSDHGIPKTSPPVNLFPGAWQR
jgi:hypothetical protein